MLFERIEWELTRPRNLSGLWCLFFSWVFSLVWVVCSWFSLYGLTTPLGFYFCALVHSVPRIVRESSNYNSRFAVVGCVHTGLPCYCRLRFAHVDAYHEQVLGGESVASALQYDNHFPRSLEVAALLVAHGGGTSGSSEHWLVPVTQPRVMCSVLTAIRDGLSFSFRNGFAPLDEDRIENEGFASLRVCRNWVGVSIVNSKIPLHWAIIILLNFCVVLQSEMWSHVQLAAVRGRVRAPLGTCLQSCWADQRVHSHSCANRGIQQWPLDTVLWQGSKLLCHS